ncbi:hypothetical protein [Bartonella tamiae]|uniref:hypothetical protein n=1 Tax=Bartonella tamiae TaxID=373638 RepID=UPI00026E77A4|nr:hypothetical protein [Bartonella tamiae]EJF92643.1 hypothetical protein MEG_01813 [Bartonella tamiae Th307]
MGIILKVIVASALTLGVSGCISKTISMYPVSGPAAQNGKSSVIRLVANNVQSTSGKLSGVLPSGATCEGQWSSTISAYQNNTQFSVTNGINTIYGQGTSYGVAPGSYPGAGVLSCTDGTTIDVEFTTGANKTGVGVARDNKGNVYRVII